MSDAIEVSVRALGSHGHLPTERVTRQPYDVEARLELDTRTAAATDDLSATVDYTQVVCEIRRLVQEESFALIETLADAVARACLQLGARRARVRVSKPAVAQLLGASAVSVVVER